MTEILGTEWTIVINPLAVWPYADESYAKERLGSCLASYVDGAISQFKQFADKYGDDGKQELNTIAYKHQLNLEYDDKKTFSYCGPAIQDGQLVILFSEKYLGTNTYDAFYDAYLQKALNSAPPQPSANGNPPPMSYAARISIKQNWDPKIGDLQKQIGALLEMPDIKLEPNFESNYAILKANEKKAGLRDDWEACFGNFFYLYFEGLLSTLQWKQFGEDEMLREGFQEGISKGEVQLKVVEKLEKGNYNECQVKDGVLYLLTQPKTWDTNISDCATNIIDLL